jgi:myo-inositol 2-dehydrogenase/D-chiro-inositol 1-dehydrogenase
MITVGIIGAGRIGKVHAENISKMRDVRLKTISDLYVESVVPWAEGQGIENITNQYQEILHDEEIDAVLICSSTQTHVPLIQEAALCGKHIFCEKPISFTIEDTMEALDVVKEKEVLLQIGFNRRFDPNFKRVHELVRSGQVGDVHIVKITSRDPAPPPAEYIKTSGGIFIDMSIHDFDMARYIVGSEVEEVYAQGAVFIDPVCKEVGDVDTAVITLKFKNGAIAVIDNSRKAVYGYDQRVEVFGSKGCVSVENDLPTTAKLLTEESVATDKPKYFFLERYKEAYVEEIRSFFHAIKYNETPLVTGEDGYQAERIAHMAKASLRANSPVQCYKKKSLLT